MLTMLVVMQRVFIRPVSGCGSVSAREDGLPASACIQPQGYRPRVLTALVLIQRVFIRPLSGSGGALAREDGLHAAGNAEPDLMCVLAVQPVHNI